MKFCTQCGMPTEDDAVFCPACGKKFDFQSAQGIQVTANNQNIQMVASSKTTLFDSATAWISKMTGGTEVVRPPLASVFSNIFVKHKKEDSEELFICGTTNTTPELSEDGKVWPTPWLWTRIFIVFAATFLLLHICCTVFGNGIVYPGIMVIGSFAVPISVMIFFFELNTPRNISFYTVIKYFLLGGVASLVLTCIFYDIFGSIENEWLNAVLISIIEEFGKLGIVVFLIWKNNDTKYALNGLLIGAAIGAGFAAFESAGYAFQALLENASYDDMVSNILLRAFLAPGGHVIWAAMSGYAVMLVKWKTDSVAFIDQKAFWQVFWIPVALHAIWDMPIRLGNSLFLVILPVTLNMIIGWVVTFVLIGNSLSQIGQILQKRREEAVAAEISVPTDGETV